MIDRDTAIQWAKDAGCSEYKTIDVISGCTEEIQSLIQRAQDEAFEKAAQLCESKESADQSAWHCAEEIRALKDTP